MLTLVAQAVPGSPRCPAASTFRNRSGPARLLRATCTTLTFATTPSSRLPDADRVRAACIPRRRRSALGARTSRAPLIARTEGWAPDAYRPLLIETGPTRARRSTPDKGTYSALVRGGRNALRVNPCLRSRKRLPSGVNRGARTADPRAGAAAAPSPSRVACVRPRRSAALPWWAARPPCC